MISSSLNWTNISKLASNLKSDSELDKKLDKETECDVEDCDSIDDSDDTNSVKSNLTKKVKFSIKSDSSDDNDDFVFKRYNSRRKRISKTTVLKKRPKDHCIECDSSAVIYDDGSYVCTECGIEQGSLYSTEAETRYYGNDDNKKGDPSRTGAPVNELLPTASLTPMISGYGREKYRELHKRYSMKYDERSLYNMINRTKSKLKDSGIPNCIIDKATVYYKLLGEENFKLRATGDNFMAACILYMCKKKGIVKTNKEIADLFGIKGKSMTKGIDSFQELIFRYNPEMIDIINPITPEDFIRRYCSDMGLRDGIMSEAVHASEVAGHLGLTKNNMPSSIAVGCIFLVSQVYDYGITRKMIFHKTKISDVTILNCYNKLLPHKIYLLNKDSINELDEIVDDDVGDVDDVDDMGDLKKKIILDIIAK